METKRRKKLNKIYKDKSVKKTEESPEGKYIVTRNQTNQTTRTENPPSILKNLKSQGGESTPLIANRPTSPSQISNIDVLMEKLMVRNSSKKLIQAEQKLHPVSTPPPEKPQKHDSLRFRSVFPTLEEVKVMKLRVKEQRKIYKANELIHRHKRPERVTVADLIAKLELI